MRDPKTEREIRNTLKPRPLRANKKDFGRVFILARKRIKAGEELTYDYGDEYFEKHIRPYGCKCSKHSNKPSSLGKRH